MTIPRTVRQSQVLNHLALMAAAGKQCPTNSAIQDVLELQNENAVQLVLTQLRSLGLISVERFANSRIITITSTGARTATPPLSKIGYTKKRSRRTEREVANQEAKRVQSEEDTKRQRRERRTELLGLDLPERDHADAARGSFSECQFPITDEMPFEFCLKRSVESTSYCAEHIERCHRPNEKGKRPDVRRIPDRARSSG